MQPEYNIVLECTVTDTVERQRRLGQVYACILGSDHSEYGLVRKAFIQPNGRRQRPTTRRVTMTNQQLIVAST